MNKEDKPMKNKGTEEEEEEKKETLGVTLKTEIHQLYDDALAGFRRSVKKVELPMFEGEDPAGWISREKVYFCIQDTQPEVKVPNKV